MISMYKQSSVQHFQHFFASANSLDSNDTVNHFFFISYADLFNSYIMTFFFIFLSQNLTSFERKCSFHFQNHQIQHASYLLFNSFFKDIQSQIQILYSVAYRVPLIISEFSARSYSHYYLSISISKDTAVIHFIKMSRIQLSKLRFHERISCR